MTTTTTNNAGVHMEITDETRGVAEKIFARAGRTSHMPADAEPTEGHLRCVQTLLAISAWHRLSLLGPVSAAVTLNPYGMTVLLGGSIATFDMSELSRLVFAAHDLAVRVELSGWAAHAGGDDEDRCAAICEDIAAELEGVDPDDIVAPALKVLLTARTHDSDSSFDRHPTLEQAIDTWRRQPQMRVC